MLTTTSQSAKLSPSETSTQVSDSLEYPAVAIKILEGSLRPDIEHALVTDDPRAWSDARKTTILVIISGASTIAGLCMSIQNPSNAQIEQQLHATRTFPFGLERSQ
ncbi:hypothetical protein ID866_8574 [Astraeus odoratus]|nr:hypothetical protein ID866_8574 [Astraeus odoratus]